MRYSKLTISQGLNTGHFWHWSRWIFEDNLEKLKLIVHVIIVIDVSFESSNQHIHLSDESRPSLHLNRYLSEPSTLDWLCLIVQ